MESVKVNAPFLSRLTYSKGGKKVLQKASEKELSILIELILNFDTFSGECSKSLKRKVNKLKNIKWNIKRSKSVLIKNYKTIQLVAGHSLIHMIESEICDVF
jgi:hypothetical protein